MDTRQPAQKGASRLAEFAEAAKARKAQGWTGRVPSLTVGHGWWVTVIDSTADGKFLRVMGKPRPTDGKSAFGRPRWVKFADFTHPKKPRPVPSAS